MSTFAEKLSYQMGVKGFRPPDVIRASKPFEEKYGATLSRQDMSNYINGHTMPKSAKLLLLCRALNVGPDYFTLEDNMSIPSKDFTVEEYRLVKGWRDLNDNEKNIIRYIFSVHHFPLDNEEI